MTALRLDQFKDEGAIFPINILDSDEVLFYQKKITEFMDQHDWTLNAVTRHKPHIYLDWANQLAKHPQIIDNIKPLLGDDILLWYSVLFVKSPHSTGYVPWHQDATYWALNKNEGLTLWLALSDVTQDNGCVEYIPGSHRWSDFEHSIDNQADNLLARGQEIKGFQVDDAKSIILAPGQASIHDVSLLHASKPNLSNQPRLGIAFRYIPADNFPKTLTFMKRSATLVAGEKQHNIFIDDPNPLQDSPEVCQKAHKKSVRVATIHTLFGDSARGIWRKIMDVGPTLFTRKTLQYFSLVKKRKNARKKDAILITGASSGIGREFCKQLAGDARLMVLTGRNLMELQKTSEAVKKMQPHLPIDLVPADLCNTVDREGLIAIAQDKKIDCVILNAGGGQFGEFVDTDWEQQSKVVELNISSTVHLCSKLVPQLLALGKSRGQKSRLVFVSSHAGYMRIPQFSVYASCKSFLNNFALTLVQELKNEPVDILVTCPGATETQFSKRAGLPTKMLSTPLSPEVVVRRSIGAIGKTHFFIVTRFDRLIYALSRFLPLSFFDRLIARTQRKILNHIKKDERGS